MRKWLSVMFLLLAVLLALPAWTQTFAIRAGNLFDPAKGTVTTHQIILVKDKKIVEVGPSVAIQKIAKSSTSQMNG
jgi:imidazolonepropionase-like amidohydrolase